METLLADPLFNRVYVAYRKGYQLKSHQVNTHTLVFVASLRYKILLRTLDADDEFVITDKPAEPHNAMKIKKNVNKPEG